ncbi:MAG TPA: CHAT domain-containing protein, partial [Longimicrobium sp.]|nr:CHAT domain-containing protein [Longimicrobium sp.]
WAEAVLGDTGRAGKRLRLAEALGAALERRGGDATLADAARAIRAHARDPRATRLLASAHREYARGRKAYREADKKGAGDHCARVLEIAPPSPALRGWAGVYRAAGISFEGDHSRAVAEFEAQRAKVDTARHPALAATLHSGLATALLRGGSHQQSRDASRIAARHYTRAGERESEGGEIFQQATTEFGMGLDWEAYATMHRALVTLRDFRASRFLHALLLSASQSLADDGFRHTALALQDEAVAVAGRTRVRAFVAESHARRAQLRAGLGDSAGAETDARAAARHLDDVVLATWPWITVDLRLVRGRLRLRTDPAGALAAFDSVAVAVDTARTVRRYVLALVGAAEARLALGDAAGAAADLQKATERLGLQGSAIETASLRASLLDGAREVFDRLVMLEVARGREREALEFLERGRVSFPPAGPREGAAAGVARPPAGSVAVVYALIGDTLLTWTVAGDTVRLVRQSVDHAGLLARVEAVRALEGSRDEAAARSVLASLYDRLVRPVERALGGAETPLVLVADGELTRVPFSALYDTRRRRYLVEARPLRFASSLRDAARAPSDAAAAGAEALVVANPAFDPRMYALEPLREAEAEARTVAATYPGARVLPGREATPSALRAALPGSRLFHFAGHAVFDDDRPGRSFLVLAPDSGGASRLMADEVAGMDLRGVGVAVLSACETLPSREGRSGGFAGFAGAFLAAGADGVVGSLWPVDDRRTRPLMVAFHRAYGRSGDGAAALRAAQLELLRGRDPDLASPSTWAAFRYAGR